MELIMRELRRRIRVHFLRNPLIGWQEGMVALYVILTATYLIFAAVSS